MIDTTQSDPLTDFTKSAFTSSTGVTHDVYRKGSGPAVIVVHEVPGITPLVAEFARKIAAQGFTVVMPHLLGTPGKPVSTSYILRSAGKACVSREFSMLATDKASPITAYLRELAEHEHEACGGPGVGTVGMCLTGGFALAMCLSEAVIAPVLSQPSLPVGIGAKRKAAVGISASDLRIVRRRVDDGLCVMGLRFSGDAMAPAERFASLRHELGDNFIGVEIDSSAGNIWGYKKAAHSVLTEDYNDDEGSPTRVALNDVLDFFESRLKA